MKVLRTPEERFRNLPDYPYVPRYADVGGVRMHYVDEGPPGEVTVLLLHGEPTWSYLYRHVIAPLCAAGHRVVAPDLIGFGRSDKPLAIADHSYGGHLAWLERWLAALALHDIVLFGQDWGALLGLRLVAAHPERFAAVAVGNGMLLTGQERLPALFQLWRLFARITPVFPAGWIVQSGTRRCLTRAERRAYDAPFPAFRYQAGPRALPRRVPVVPDDPEAVANRWAWERLRTWHKPFLTLFSDGDPITRGIEYPFQRQVPGAAGQPHRRLQGGHFLQEDAPAAIAAALDRLIRALIP